MNPCARRTYNGGVMATLRRRALGWLPLAFALGALFGGAATAAPLEFPASAPVVYVRMTQGNVTVRTWQRDVVRVDGAPTVEARALPQRFVARRLPHQIMLWSQRVRTKDGATLTLPAEPFPLPDLAAAAHDGVLVRGNGNATIMIPANTALLVTVVRRGAIALSGYRNGTFAALMGGGRITLSGVGGTGAVQLNNGPFVARNSDFARIRVRTGRGAMYFEHCNAAQIQATSLLGSIVYDNGTFAPGLARFESERGNIALGVNGGAQINAHSDAGRIFDARGAQVTRGANDAQAAFERGGPVVTATSKRGAVIFYRGALRAHPQLLQRFKFRRVPAMKRFGGGRPIGRPHGRPRKPR